MDNDLEEVVLAYPKIVERMKEKGVGKDKEQFFSKLHI